MGMVASIASTIIGAASSARQGKKQREAARDAEEKQNKMQQEAEQREKDLLLAEAERGKELQTAEFGLVSDEEVGTYDDFLTPVSGGKSGLNTSPTSALGFKI